MQQGVELEQYLTTCQSIPVTFIIPHYPLLSSKWDYFMPVLQERSKEETKSYCKLLFILVPKVHVTGDGVGTIFDYMPKHSSFIHNTPAVSSTITKITSFHASTRRKK